MVPGFDRHTRVLVFGIRTLVQGSDRNRKVAEGFGRNTELRMGLHTVWNRVSHKELRMGCHTEFHRAYHRAYHKEFHRAYRMALRTEFDIDTRTHIDTDSRMDLLCRTS